MESENIFSILKRIPFFADLSELKHAKMVKNISMRSCPAGYTFFKEGDDTTKSPFFIILKGMVNIFRKNSVGENHCLATLKNNDFFGEMGILTNEARNATAQAAEDCHVLEIPNADFLNLIQSCPNMAAKISETYINREKGK